jgi:predicted transcriptional regulator
MADTEANLGFEAGLDDKLQARLDAEGLADVAAGRVIPHEIVAEWLTKLANGQRVPPPFDD